MKTIIVTTLLVVFSSVSLSQTEEKSKESPNERVRNQPETISTSDSQSFEGVTNASKSVTISKRAGEEQKIHDASYYSDEIEKIDQHISAINQKITYVNNHRDEKTIAIENGWFEAMTGVLEQLTEKKSILKTKLEELKLNQ